MKKIFYVGILTIAVISLFMVSCNKKKKKEETVDLASKIIGTYNGYCKVSCAFFTDKVTDEETLTVSKINNNAVSLSFVSSQWGTFSFEEATINVLNNTYTLKERGKCSMGNAGEIKEYECTLESVITPKSGNAFFIVSVPDVMGGFTLQFNEGKKKNNFLSYQKTVQNLKNSGAVLVSTNPIFTNHTKEDNYSVETYQLDDYQYVLYIFSDTTSNSFIDKQQECTMIYEEATDGNGHTIRRCYGEGNTCVWFYDSKYKVMILITCDDVS